MAIKSLTITEQAYTALKNVKTGNESFSQVILRVTNERKGNNLEKFFGALKGKEGEEFEKRIKEGRKKVEQEVQERERKYRGERK